MSVFIPCPYNMCIGNIAAGRDANLHGLMHIDVVINLAGGLFDAGKPRTLDYVYDFALPRDELLDSETERINTKLRSIMHEMQELDFFSGKMLIVAEDHRNAPLLLVGYILINMFKQIPADTVEMLELINLTAEQRKEEITDRKRPLHEVAPYDAAAEVRKEERRRKLCLTFVSFKKLLCPPSDAPKTPVWLNSVVNN